MRIMITGGAGFIGSALVRYLINSSDHEILVVDKLTYAGNLASLATVQGNSRYRFSHTDICNRSVASVAGRQPHVRPPATIGRRAASPWRRAMRDCVPI